MPNLKSFLRDIDKKRVMDDDEMLSVVKNLNQIFGGDG